MSLEKLRAEIDAVDAELLRLINRRAQMAVSIGAIKQAAGLPLCDAERERDVLTQVRRANAGPLGAEAVTHIFRLIIRESRRVEVASVSQAAEEMRELS